VEYVRRRGEPDEAEPFVDVGDDGKTRGEHDARRRDDVRESPELLSRYHGPNLTEQSRSHAVAPRGAFERRLPAWKGLHSFADSPSKATVNALRNVTRALAAAAGLAATACGAPATVAKVATLSPSSGPIATIDQRIGLSSVPEISAALTSVDAKNIRRIDS